MRKSHIVFIVFCVAWVVLMPLSVDSEYVEKYGYDVTEGEFLLWLIPFGIFYWIYLKFEKKRQQDPTIL